MAVKILPMISVHLQRQLSPLQLLHNISGEVAALVLSFPRFDSRQPLPMPIQLKPPPRRFHRLNQNLGLFIGKKV